MGVLALLLALTAVSLIAYLLEDSLGVPYRAWGAFIWATALLVAFFFGVLYYSQFILPVGGGEGWSQGLILLLRHYLQQGGRYLKNLMQPSPPQKRRIIGDKPISDPDALPETFKTLKAGMVRSHQVLALDRKGRFQRPAGPGFVMLSAGESIRTVIDLRPHVRSQTVKANTRDGIPIEANLFVTFRARQNPPQTDLQYPYDRDAIFHIAYASTVRQNEEMRPWTEQACPRAAALLALELARCTLDDLYRISDSDALPLENIQSSVKKELLPKLEQQGIELLNVAVSDLVLPKEVEEQRLKNWQARWQQEIELRRAQGNAEAMRRIKKARARVQIEIVESIIQNIETMHRNETAELADIVMLRMIQVLEEAMSNASVQALVPESIMSGLVWDTSRQLRTWTKKPPAAEEKESSQ